MDQVVYRGVVFDRDVIRHPGAVAVVAITDDDAVVLAQQYRGAVDRWLLELPAGTCDVEGEPPEVTANRELAEEVGYSAAVLTLLTRCAITPGFCDEYASIYLGTGLTPVPFDRQGIEEGFMRVIEVPLDRFDLRLDPLQRQAGEARRRQAEGGHRVTSLQQSPCQVRGDEAVGAGDQRSLHRSAPVVARALHGASPLSQRSLRTTASL